MPDDQVTIDPQFSPLPPGDGQSRWLRPAGIGAVVVAAFIFGWLLRSPSPTDTEADEAAVTSSTALVGETVAASTTTRPPTTTTVAEMVGLEVPLGEAVPGFTDAITMVVWGNDRDALVRWQPWQPAPETVAAFDYEDPPWFAGLDASGRWYALMDDMGNSDSGVLRVRPVIASVDESWPSAAFREAVGVRVTDLAWHDSESSQLGWVTCSRTLGGPGMLYTLDVADGTAEPVPIHRIDDACGGYSGAWLDRWGDWGFALGRWEEGGDDWSELFAADGTPLAQFGRGTDGGWLVAGRPDGTVWTEDPLGPAASSFLLSLDGQHRSSIPGLGDDEWLDDALWSPDGSHVALAPRRSPDGPSTIRIIATTTGNTVTEIAEPDAEVSPAAWSSDSRFLLYRREAGGGGWGPPADVELVVYDTATGVATGLSFPEGHGFWEVRTSEPAPAAEQLTPVEWGIAPDDSGPGTHSVSMIAGARPLMPDQVEDLSGRLIWDGTVVDLCNIEIRHVGDGFLHIGDIFGTDEGCGSNPTALQEAFDEFGLPETACVAVRVGGLDHEYCAPLS